jgi:hypothetical protein
VRKGTKVRGNSRKAKVVRSSTYDVTQLVLLVPFSVELSEINSCHLMDDQEVKQCTFVPKSWVFY